MMQDFMSRSKFSQEWQIIKTVIYLELYTMGDPIYIAHHGIL